MKGSGMLDKRGDASRRGAEREVDALKTLKDPEHGGSAVQLQCSGSGYMM